MIEDPQTQKERKFLNTTNLPPWTDEDKTVALAGLKTIREHGFRAGGQNLPKEVFFAWLETFYGIAVEVVITTKENPIMIYLLKRPDDPADVYAGQWHTSGSILLPKEEDVAAACRVVRKEVGVEVDPTRIKFVRNFDNTKSPRGHEPQHLYLLELEPFEIASMPQRGKWFPLNQLPPLVESHYALLIEAVKANLDSEGEL